MPYRLLLLAVLLLGGGCTREAAVTPSMDDVRAEGAPTRESWGVRFSVYESPLGRPESNPRMEIQAGYMAAYDQGDSTYTVLERMGDSTAAPVRAYLFDAQGDTSAVVVAHRMVYFDLDRRIEARGRVVVETTSGKRLETEVLFWNEQNRRVRTPGFARITTPTERLQGFGLDADENLDTYTLARVTGQVTLEDE